MKAASTTKVAPCSACAGPNTAPRNEWAIMMWSRTSTANKGTLSGIADELAEYAAPGLRISGRRARQVRANATAGASSASSRGSRSELSAASSRWRCVNVARCDGATLPTWLETSFSRRLWNAPPSGTAHRARRRTSSVRDGRLVAGECRARWQARPRWRWRGRRGRNRPAPRRAWRSSTPSARASSRARRIDVDQASPRRPRAARTDKPTSAPTTPAPTTAMRPAGPGARVPDRVERRLHVGGQHRALRRHAVGQRHHGARPAG